MNTGERMVIIEEQLKENINDHKEIKEIICKTKDSVELLRKEFIDLKMNHIVFKTRVLAFWVIGAALLSAMMQVLISWLVKHI